MKEYPIIRIEVVDKDRPPTSNNIRIYWNEQDISGSVYGFNISGAVSHITRVTLDLYASVETDGLIMTGATVGGTP